MTAGISCGRLDSFSSSSRLFLVLSFGRFSIVWLFYLFYLSIFLWDVTKIKSPRRGRLVVGCNVDNVDYSHIEDTWLWHVDTQQVCRLTRSHQPNTCPFLSEFLYFVWFDFCFLIFFCAYFLCLFLWKWVDHCRFQTGCWLIRHWWHWRYLLTTTPLWYGISSRKGHRMSSLWPTCRLWWDPPQLLE